MLKLHNFRIFYRSNSGRLILEASGLVEATDVDAALNAVWLDYEERGYRIWHCVAEETSQEFIDQIKEQQEKGEQR